MGESIALARCAPSFSVARSFSNSIAIDVAREGSELFKLLYLCSDRENRKPSEVSAAFHQQLIDQATDVRHQVASEQTSLAVERRQVASAGMNTCAELC